MTGILGQLKWESLKKRRKTIDLYCYIKVLKVKPLYQQMTLSPKLGVVEISTLWHFRLPLVIQTFIKVASSPRLSGIGMPSTILWSHLLKMQRIVLLSSLLWWELGTNSLITGPGEWLSLRRFTTKLSWSWSWPKKKYICVFQVSRPYLGFCPNPKHFKVNCEQNVVKFAKKCNFCIKYFDKIKCYVDHTYFFPYMWTLPDLQGDSLTWFF